MVEDNRVPTNRSRVHIQRLMYLKSQKGLHFCKCLSVFENKAHMTEHLRRWHNDQEHGIIEYDAWRQACYEFYNEMKAGIGEMVRVKDQPKEQEDGEQQAA